MWELRTYSKELLHLAGCILSLASGESGGLADEA